MSIKEKLMLKGLNIALKASPDNINLLYDRAFYNLRLNLVDKALEDVDRILDIVTSYDILSARMYLLMISICGWKCIRSICLYWTSFS